MTEASPGGSADDVEPDEQHPARFHFRADTRGYLAAGFSLTIM